MQKRLIVLAFALAALASLTVAPRAQQPAESDEAKRIRESITVFGEIMRADDQSIPKAILSKAEGIAIFPNMIKAGLVVGGVRGRGVLSARHDASWSSPTFMTLTGGSFGLQIGAQAADIILVVQDRRGLEGFVRNQFKFGTDASVAAGPVGRDAQASTDLQLRAQILSYSRARGLFAGGTINGRPIPQGAAA